jgi:Rps23 Pro-64 3,4-dihydroxylase Tpa1-like proline 4-hydroxylase
MLSQCQIDDSYRSLSQFGLVVFRKAIDLHLCDDIHATAKRDAVWERLHFGTYRNGNLVDLDTSATDINSMVSYQFDFPEAFESEIKRASGIFSKEFWGIEPSSFSRFTAGRMTKGMSLGAHKDSRYADTPRVITVVCYFSPEFEGGHLTFPDLRVSIRPTQGDVVMFYSEHNHAVSTVEGGDRITGVFFIHV